MVDKAVFQVRISDDLYNHLRTISKAEGRSLNNMIEFFLMKSVEAYENKISNPKK